jgi:hypothetical protein
MAAFDVAALEARVLSSYVRDQALIADDEGNDFFLQVSRVQITAGTDGRRTLSPNQLLFIPISLNVGRNIGWVCTGAIQTAHPLS